ncbi:MAG: regulatory protein [Bacteroidia bacterium]|jgi:regulatory protein
MTFNTEPPKRQKKDFNQGWIAIQKFCAYQERCHKEVRNRLYEYGLYPDEVEELIANLIESNFINEERFAKAYARGKFNAKKWGRLKIVAELKRRQISEYCIRKSLEEINDDDYINTLNVLINRKQRDYKSTGNQFVLNKKVADFCFNKGYESELIWTEIKKHQQ